MGASEEATKGLLLQEVSQYVRRQRPWKQTSGLAADSTVARIICKDPDKEEWDEEAEEKGYRSTSK
jgi:hypothetical protein